MEIKVDQSSIRIDKYLTQTTDISRSQIQKQVNDGTITVGGIKVKPNYKLKIDEIISIEEVLEENQDIEPQDLDLDIVYEDEYLLIINKPSGMVVHPSLGHYDGTLVNGLLHYSNSLSNIGGKFRPGIVHRIDKDTSGLIMVAKDNKTHDILSDLIRKREVSREYKAIVHGQMDEEEAEIIAPIGRDAKDRKKMAVTDRNSKEATTFVKVLSYNDKYTLIKCSLLTGRTHQIRVHMKYINYPVMGDTSYGPKKTFDVSGQALHAFRLKFIHPYTKEKIEVYAPLEDAFIKALEYTKLSDVND